MVPLKETADYCQPRTLELVMVLLCTAVQLEKQEHTHLFCSLVSHVVGLALISVPLSCN